MTGLIISGERQREQKVLFERAARAATGFDALGVGENDSIALMLRNDFVFLEAAFGAGRIGAYAVPINWHFTADEAGYILRDCGAKVLIVHADLLPRIAAGIPDEVAVLVAATPPEIRAAYGIAEAAGAVPAGQRAWDQWIAAQRPWTREAPAQRSNMIYTSGTTGRPKGVRREPMTATMAATMAEMAAAAFDIRDGAPTRTVMTGPMYHSAPNHYGLRSTQVEGSTVVLQPRFDAEDLLRLIAHHAITHLHMVPTMFVRLLQLPEAVRRRYDVSSLRFVVHGAAPCPPEIKRRMIEWWGPVINEYYGATETGAVVFHTAAEALAKPGTVGRPLPFGEARIYDDGGRVLGPGEIGEVYLRLNDFPDFTYQGRDEDRRAIDRDGLVTAGDVGYIDEDGYLFLCDRRRDMLISGGVNIYPAEIEAVLIDMPGVRDCAVFGIPDDEFGEAVCAHVEADPASGLNADAVRAYLRGRIADYKLPRVVAFEDRLPREDSGKVFKRKLREPYWQDTGRQI